jgi:hypothetical protein
MDEPILRVEFVLDEEGPTSPTDFLDFVAYADGYMQGLLAAEIADVTADLPLPDAARPAVKDETRYLLRNLPLPAEVREVRHSSPWTILLYVPAAILIPFIHKCINPVVREAWNDSQLRDSLYTFLRDRLFRGALSKAKRQLKRSPRRRNVTARDVKDLSAHESAAPLLQVRVTRSEVFEASTTDARLIEEFRERLRQR